MNRSEFYSHFTSSLRLGGQRRDDVCAELTAHLHELEDRDVERIMGDPISLARAYNIRHLGPWRGVSWMFLTPFIAWVLLIRIWSALHNGAPVDTPVSGTWWLPVIGALVLVVILTAFVVFVLARLLRPWPTYVALLALTLLIGTTFFSMLEYRSRAGRLDPGRLELVMSNASSDVPQFRDRTTGQFVEQTELDRYVIPVDMASVILPAVLMNAVLVGGCALLTYPYIRRRQRRFSVATKRA